MNRILLMLGWMVALGAMPLAAQEPSSGAGTTSRPVEAPAVGGAPAPAPTGPAMAPPVTIEGPRPDTTHRVMPPGEIVQEPIPAADTPNPPTPPAQTPPTRPVRSPTPPGRE